MIALKTVFKQARNVRKLKSIIDMHQYLISMKIEDILMHQW